MTIAAPTQKPTMPRRHDLDALRAIAMLLGIVLHAAGAYVPGAPWFVQDEASSELIGLFTAFIHGFRMPLFFVMSGFFTAMLWRKRGLRAMLKQRFKRIFMPLVVAMLTVMPIMWGIIIGIMVISVPHRMIEAATANDTTALKTRLMEGVDVNTGTGWQTALHAAVEAGSYDAAQLLLDAGADVHATNTDGITPLDIAIQNNDAALIALLQSYDPLPNIQPKMDAHEAKANNDFFGHLWFLWFLCWLVVGFAIIAPFTRLLRWLRLPDRMVTGRTRYLWLVPLTMIPQAWMSYPSFGPDTSTGIIPMFHVLFYYAIFFGFGAIYYHYEDNKPRRRTWWIELFIACLLYLPALITSVDEAREGWWFLPMFLQSLFTWLMIFGSMTLFRRFFNKESKRMRYISDSAYWQYLMHIPMLFIVQQAIVDVPAGAWVKLAISSVLTSLLLLWMYEHLIRYRWPGRLLNGPRKRETDTRDNTPDTPPPAPRTIAPDMA